MRAQTAMSYEAGKPDPETGQGQAFEPGMLWDVVRTLCPTREIILDAWSRSLEANVTTSAHGQTAMTSLCSHVGLQLDGILRRLPSLSAAQEEQPPGAAGGSHGGAVGGERDWELERLMQLNSPATEGELGAFETTLAQTRRARMRARTIFRLNPAAVQSVGETPAQMIRTALARTNNGGAEEETSATNALFPTLRCGAMYYHSRALLRWCNGRTVGYDENDGSDPSRAVEVQNMDLFGGFRSGSRRAGGLSFAIARHDNNNGQDGGAGAAREFDFAWFNLTDPPSQRVGGQRQVGFKQNATLAHNYTDIGTRISKEPACALVDMHPQGCADVVNQLASKDNSRDCPEMPVLDWLFRQSGAFKRHAVRVRNDKGEVTNSGDMGDASNGMSVNGFTVMQSGRPKVLSAHQSPPNGVEQFARWNTNARDARGSLGYAKVPMHKEFDHLVNRGRLQALLPHVSTVVHRTPPLRWENGQLQLNAVVAYEHVAMQAEASLRCHRLPGLRGLQEFFPNMMSPPEGLSALEHSATQGVPVASNRPLSPSLAKGVTKTLPWSYDMWGIASTLWAGERLYNEERTGWIQGANEVIRSEALPGGELLVDKGAVEISMRFPAYQRVRSGVHGTTVSNEMLRLLTFPMANRKLGSTKSVEFSSMQKVSSHKSDRYEAWTALGRPGSEADVELHKRGKTNTGNTRGVQGDIYAYSTWQKFVRISMTEQHNTPLTDDGAGENNVDPGLCEGLLDAETLVFPRLLERRVRKNPTAAQHIGLEDLQMPIATTFTYEDPEQDDDEHDGHAVGSKRLRASEHMGVQRAIIPRMGAALARVPAASAERASSNSNNSNNSVSSSSRGGSSRDDAVQLGFGRGMGQRDARDDSHVEVEDE